MSQENPEKYFRDLYPELYESGPSPSLFSGFAKKEGGIFMVHYADELSEAVNDGLSTCGHFYAQDSGIRDSSEASDPTIQKKLREAESIVKETTGFTPREFIDRRVKLLQIFRGKHPSEAPFPIEIL